MDTENDIAEPHRSDRFVRSEADLPTGRLTGFIRRGVGQDWVIGAIKRVEQGPGRRHGSAELPDGEKCFVKVYNPRVGHSLWRRLRRSRAIAEGEGYQAFARAGIETPELIAWGEVRRRGLWMIGFVITRLIDGPTVAEDFAARGDALVIGRAAECLAKIHRAGLAHGDPRLRNFLVSGGTVLPFDLCSWGRLSVRGRDEDLVKFLGSAMTLAPRSTAETLLDAYAERAAWRPARRGRLIDDATAYARKEGVA